MNKVDPDGQVAIALGLGGLLFVPVVGEVLMGAAVVGVTVWAGYTAYDRFFAKDNSSEKNIRNQNQMLVVRKGQRTYQAGQKEISLLSVKVLTNLLKDFVTINLGQEIMVPGLAQIMVKSRSGEIDLLNNFTKR